MIDQITRAFEVLWIVLFRFDPLPRVWAILLIAVNLAALAFVDTIYGQVSVATSLAGVLVIVLLYLRLGFVRLLGIGHVFWIPMLVGFALNMPERQDTPLLYAWAVALLIVNAVSLIIDTIDVTRYLRGEREPFHHW